MSTFKRIPVLEQFSWQPPVIDITNTELSTLTGNRFIVGSDPEVGTPFEGHANSIAWYDGENWNFDIPQNGWKTFVTAKEVFYVFIDGSWENESEALTDTFMKRADEADATDGFIPVWDGNDGDKIKDGYQVATGVTESDLDRKIFRADIIKTYVDGIVGATDAMVYKGAIDASGNPDYPAADTGHTYKISVAGKIGGVDGEQVEVGDMLICLADDTLSGDQATVGGFWNIIQTNIEGYVLGPASSTSGRLAVFDNTTGNLIGDGGVNAVDIEDIRTHLDDPSIHFVIDDNNESSGNTYSSKKIEELVGDVSTDLTTHADGDYTHGDIDAHILTENIHRSMSYNSDNMCVFYSEDTNYPPDPTPQAP